MPHINQLVDQFGSKGFVAVGITSESAGETRKFLEETGAKWTTMYDTKAGDQWGISGFPSSYLIDPSGTVVWKGHPGNLKDHQITDLLPKVKLPLGLPAKYAGVNGLFDKEKYGEAKAKIDAELAKPDLADGDRQALEGGAKRINSLASTLLEEAKKAEGEKDAYTALQAYDRIGKQFVGMEEAKEASLGAARIQADASLKPELEAGAKVAEAGKKLEGGASSYQSAWKMLSAVIKSYPDSAAAAKASKMQAAMRDQGKYGFSPNCKECKKQGKACGECRTSAKW